MEPFSVKLQAAHVELKDPIMGFFLWDLTNFMFFLYNTVVGQMVLFLLGFYEFSIVILKQLQC